MDIEWVETVDEARVLIREGYDIKIAGVGDTVGWWAIKPERGLVVKNYRVRDSIIDELKLQGYREQEKGISCMLVKI